MQRALMLGIIQVYTDFRKKQDEISKNFIFLIDEAEIHLHPTAQRALKTALSDIVANGDQVFINTHSSVMINGENTNEQIYKVEKTLGITDVAPITESDKAQVIFNLLGGSPVDILLPANYLIVEGSSDAVFLSKVIHRFYSTKPKIQIIYAEGDALEQARSLDAIGKVYAPLVSNPVYKNKIVTVCEKPKTPAAQTHLISMKKAFPAMESAGHIIELPVFSIEEYYPSPWKKTTSEVSTMISKDKKDLAEKVGDSISQSEFESEMEVFLTALNKAWNAAFQ